MSHNPAWSGADDLVPPFLQEPAFGSPEAVRRAADEIFPGRGIAPGLVSAMEEAGVMRPEAVEQAAETIRPCGSCGGRGYVPDEEAGSRACRDCNSEGHLPTCPDEPAHDLLAEVERLRAEAREDEVSLQRAAFLLGEENIKRVLAGKQRDALADALELIQPRLRRWRTSGIQAGAMGRDRDFEDLVAAVEAALRKAGRLP